MAQDRFGNPLDPSVGYARGRFLSSSAAEILAALDDLAPSPEFMSLFKAVVLDVYRTRREEAGRLAAAQDRRVRALEKRKARLEEAYLYDQSIDRDTYQRHLDRVNEDRAVALMEGEV